MDFLTLSRRERQIVQILFAQKEATVNEICEQLSGSPTPMAVRRMLAILMEKDLLRRKKRGREFVYLPKQSRKKTGAKALRDVVQTFFDGSIGQALATHISAPGSTLSEDDVDRLNELIEQLDAEEDEEA